MIPQSFDPWEEMTHPGIEWLPSLRPCTVWLYAIAINMSKGISNLSQEFNKMSDSKS